MNERIQIWLERLTLQYNQSQANMIRSMGSNIVPSRIQYSIDEGKKYYKIWYGFDYNGGHMNPVVPLGHLDGLKVILDGSKVILEGRKVIHAFVDKVTGEVYKPSSRRSPARIVRYNLLNDESFNNMIENCDWAGGYLYIR